MKRIICSFAFVAIMLSSLTLQTSGAGDATALKQEGYALSLELKFSKKNQNTLQRAVSFFDWGPNGFATGFLVGDGLVMTAYHVVSGDLSVSKRAMLGFTPKDQLEVKVYINGCQATVLKVDPDADLALLRGCRSQKQLQAPAFQMSPDKDERLMMIARPHGAKMVRRGILHGPYMFRGQQYWSAKLDGRDGYSGSPVYNDKGEVVGVFSGYDWSNKLAVISPGSRAQKLLEDYALSAKP